MFPVAIPFPIALSLPALLPFLTASTPSLSLSLTFFPTAAPVASLPRLALSTLTMFPITLRAVVAAAAGGMFLRAATGVGFSIFCNTGGRVRGGAGTAEEAGWDSGCCGGGGRATTASAAAASNSSADLALVAREV